MTDEIKGFVQQNAFRSFGDGAQAPLKLNRRGEMCVVDFFTQMAMEKRGFELRGGLDSAEETGDVVATTTASEACVEAVSGLAFIPCYFAGSITGGNGTVTEIHLNTIGTAPTAGTAIAANPLWKGSTIASTAVCQLDDAGGVTTTAVGVTTTNLLFTWGGEIALGAYNMTWEYKPLMPSLAVGPVTCHTQIAATGTGPEYYFTLHWIELPTVTLA